MQYTGCTAIVHWPAEFLKFQSLPNKVVPAGNGAWQSYSLQGPNLPGTYVVTFEAEENYQPLAGNGGYHPCTGNGPITATLVVKKPLVIPLAQESAVSMPVTPSVKPSYIPVNPGNPGEVR